MAKNEIPRISDFPFLGLCDGFAKVLNSVLNVKAVVAAFNQEKVPVGAFSVITNLRVDLRFMLYWLSAGG